mgnify:CR=1 FL=1
MLAIGESDLRNPVALSWLAGLLDGEGSFSPTRGVMISLGMTDPEPVEFASKMTRTPVSIRDDPKTPHHKRQWRIQVTGDRARWAMIHVLPFMSPRRRKAIEICLDRPRTRKLTSEVEDKIKRDYLADIGGLHKLGRMYGVSHGTIWNIVHGRPWLPKNK